MKKRFSDTTQLQKQQNRLFERLQNKPFWIWGQQQHKLQDIRTTGDCCFNHIIGLPQKNGIETGEIIPIATKGETTTNQVFWIIIKIEKFIKLNIVTIDCNYLTCVFSFKLPENYPDIAPIPKVRKVIEKCHGVIIPGFKQIYISNGISKKRAARESKLKNYFLPTPWNDIEAGMAFMRDLPILIICEKGIEGVSLMRVAQILSSIRLNSLLGIGRTQRNSSGI